MDRCAEELPDRAAPQDAALPRPAGLYVHVPFCRSKCPYCDFFSVPSTDLVPEWMQALEREVRMYASGSGSFDPPPFDTLYLGGGTPTVLEDHQLGRLLDCLTRSLSLSAKAEITLEANPNDLTPSRLGRLKALGVNRLSVGVQSLRDPELRLLGRAHTAGEALRALKTIRARGPWNLGIDLLFALPEQTEKQWLETLAAALAFEPEHISCYQLTVKDDTPLAEDRKAGRFSLPGEEAQRRLFCAAAGFLEDRGYAHYEVSNYARRKELEHRGPEQEEGKTGQPAPGASEEHHLPGCFRDFAVCRHNLKYWDRSAYLGLGPSAHSFRGKRRWWNLRSVRGYCEALGRGELPVAGSEELTPEQERLERLALAWRTAAGIPAAELGEAEETQAALARLVAGGHVRRVGDCYVPTREGYLLADRIPLLFL